MTDIWLEGVDEVLILRTAYTVAALVGVPCALWCLWASIQSWRAVTRAGLNGGLIRAARGYRRRDLYGLGTLALIATAGVIAVTGNLPLRSVFGLVVLLTIAVWTTHDRICDYRDRQMTVKPADVRKPAHDLADLAGEDD